MGTDATIVIRANDKTKKAFASVNKGLGKMRAGINSTQLKVGVLASVAGFGAIIRSSLKTADALAKTADKIGISTEALAGLQNAAEITGVSQETLNKALVKQQVAVSDYSNGIGLAKREFEQLGFAQDELSKMSADKQFFAIAEALKQVENSTERVNIAYKIYGGRATDLLNTLDLGKEGLRKSRKESDLFGTSLSRVDAAKIELANDSMTRIGQVTKGFGLQLTTELAPILTDIAELFIVNAKAAGGFGNVATNLVGDLVMGVGYLGNAWRGMEIIWSGLKVAFAGQIDYMIGRLDRLQQGVVAFINIIPGVDIKPFQGLADAASAVGSTLVDVQAELFDLMMKPLPTQNIEQWLKKVKEKQQAAAEEIAKLKNRPNNAGLDVGVIDTSENPELLAAIKLEEDLTAIYDERDAAHLERTKENAAMWSAVWADSINNFASGMGGAVAGVMMDQRNMSEALQSLMKQVTKQVISSLVEIGVKRGIMFVTAQTQEKAIVLSGVASAQALSLAYAPAAAAASLASFGGNSGPAMAGISATHSLSKSLAIAGSRELGGEVTKGKSYIINERGDEVFTPKQSGTITPNHRIEEGGNNVINVTVIANDANSFDGQLNRGAATIWNIIMDQMNEEGLSWR